MDAPPAPRSPQERRLLALARGCELVLCAARPAASAAGGARWAEASADAFRVALARAAQSAGIGAAVLLDGPAVRAALRPGRFDRDLRVALWADARSQEAVFQAAPPRRPGPARKPSPWPDELWWTGPRGDASPDEFLPAAFWNIAEASAGTMAARFASAAGAPAAARRSRGLTTIVIPCWNGLADTRVCLEAVLKRTRIPFEVIVVDNGSTDGTARYVRSLRDRRIRLIVHETNLGFARAINRGLAAARGAYAVWLNNDCVVTEGWLERLQRALERAPWIGAVGPMTDGANGLQRVAGPSPAARDLARFAAACSLAYDGRMTWAHRLVGFCVLHRTELLRRIGFLDERFGLGCYEDFDWSLRARQAGYELYVAEDVFVAHRGHASFIENRVEHGELMRRNRALFVEKWCRQGLEFLDELEDTLETARLRERRRAARRR
jgi:GT2 family glycosyltransferase